MSTTPSAATVATQGDAEGVPAGSFKVYGGTATLISGIALLVAGPIIPAFWGNHRSEWIFTVICVPCGLLFVLEGWRRRLTRLDLFRTRAVLRRANKVVWECRYSDIAAVSTSDGAIVLQMADGAKRIIP